LTKYRKISVAVYFLVYLSHIIIGDLVLCPINILYPISDFIVSGGIMFNTISGTITEGILFAMMAIIIIKRSLYKDTIAN
jgi:hypothetical protein